MSFRDNLTCWYNKAHEIGSRSQTQLKKNPKKQSPGNYYKGVWKILNRKHDHDSAIMSVLWETVSKPQAHYVVIVGQILNRKHNTAIVPVLREPMSKPQAHYVVIVGPFPSASLPASSWHKIGQSIVCFSVFMLYVAWKGLPRKFARFVLFRPIKKRSFNLLCVLDDWLHFISQR